MENFRLWVSGIWVLATVVMLIWAFGGCNPRKWTLPPKTDWRIRALTVAWIVGPPLWFILEFAFFWDGEHPKPEEFKYAQELARNVWIAVAAALGALLGFDLRGKSAGPDWDLAAPLPVPGKRRGRRDGRPEAMRDGYAGILASNCATVPAINSPVPRGVRMPHRRRFAYCLEPRGAVVFLPLKLSPGETSCLSCSSLAPLF
jgi:hypothetical protein